MYKFFINNLQKCCKFIYQLAVRHYLDIFCIFFVVSICYFLSSLINKSLLEHVLSVNFLLYLIFSFYLFIIYYLILNGFSENPGIRIIQRIVLFFVFISILLSVCIYLGIFIPSLPTVRPTGECIIIIDENFNIEDEDLKISRELSNNLPTLALDRIKNEFNIDAYYKFLDSLTQIEELSFLHVLIFIYILLTVFSIVCTLFSNEFIKYFNLEEKYPRLGLFFRLRATYQRYYLIWNILLLIAACIIGLILNILTLLY